MDFRVHIGARLCARVLVGAGTSLRGAPWFSPHLTAVMAAMVVCNKCNFCLFLPLLSGCAGIISCLVCIVSCPSCLVFYYRR